MQIEHHSLPNAPTRGMLAPNWVAAAPPGEGAAAAPPPPAAQGPLQYLASLPAEAFAGFNLVAADLTTGQVGYLGNKGCSSEPVLLPPGVHALSNGRMNCPWPKMEVGKAALQALIEQGAFSRGGSGGGCGWEAPANGQQQQQQQRREQQQEQHWEKQEGNEQATTEAEQAQRRNQPEGKKPASGSSSRSTTGSTAPPGSSSGGGGLATPWDQLFALLSRDEILETDPSRLPDTGYGPEFESAVSSIFVRPLKTPWGTFGTRSQTVLAVGEDGAAELREQWLAEDGSWREVRHAFLMDLSAPRQ